MNADWRCRQTIQSLVIRYGNGIEIRPHGLLQKIGGEFRKYGTLALHHGDVSGYLLTFKPFDQIR
jgi:hypothetical protein